LRDIGCPVYLLEGEADEITSKEQVFAAEHLVGTPKAEIAKAIAPGGHVGLFIGENMLRGRWPEIARWMLQRAAA